VGGLEEQLKAFDQIGSGRLDRVALARDVQLRAERHVGVVIPLARPL